MAWRAAASRSLLAARGRPQDSVAARVCATSLSTAPRRRLPAFGSSPPLLAAARPLAAMMGSAAAAAAARLTAHPAACVRACCELSQGTPFCRTCQDR